MHPKLLPDVAVSAILWLLQASTGSAPALELDRNIIYPCEPLLLTISNYKLSPSEPVRLAVAGESFNEDIQIPGVMWIANEKQGKIFTVLCGDYAKNRYIFRDAGKYSISLRTGATTNSTSLTVLEANMSELAAYESIGPKLFPLLFLDSWRSEPHAELVKACTSISKQFPGTSCARYCDGYLAVAEFKSALKVHDTTGGKNVYQPIADRLLRCLTALEDGNSYSGQLPFFYAYALTLSGEDRAALQFLEKALSVRPTPWFPLLEKLKSEIASDQAPPGARTG